MKRGPNPAILKQQTIISMHWARSVKVDEKLHTWEAFT